MDIQNQDFFFETQQPQYFECFHSNGSLHIRERNSWLNITDPVTSRFTVLQGAYENFAPGLEWAIDAQELTGIILEYADGYQHYYPLGMTVSHSSIMTALELTTGFQYDLLVAVSSFVIPYLRQNAQAHRAMNAIALTIHQQQIVIGTTIQDTAQTSAVSLQKLHYDLNDTNGS